MVAQVSEIQIVVLTGAGMSAESGLSTFRDSGGLWEGFDIQDVATPEGWKRDPARVLDFYNMRRKQAMEAEPNDGHKALARLEAFFNVNIITQNVDDLHERGGSSHVLHLHGELRKARSENNPGLIRDIGGEPIRLGEKAEDGAQLRPHVVWFGESVPMMEQAVKVVNRADIFIVIGTSLAVYPAAGLIEYTPPGIPKYMIDPAEPERGLPEEWTHMKTGAALGTPELVEQLIQKFNL